MSPTLDAPLEAFSLGQSMDFDLQRAFLLACHLASLLFSPSMFPMELPLHVTRYFVMQRDMADAVREPVKNVLAEFVR